MGFPWDFPSPVPGAGPSWWVGPTSLAAMLEVCQGHLENP